MRKSAQILWSLLFVINITQEAVVTRQTTIDPVAWPVLGK
jgi:hypothetical protein